MPMIAVSLHVFRKSVCLALAPAFALTGCSSIQVRLGRKVHLDKLPVNAMEARMARDPGIAPGEKAPLVVTLSAPDGKTWTSEGAGQGKVLWSDLAIAASVVSANKKGVLSLPRDPRISDGKTGHVTIVAPSHPELRAELDIPLRYDHKFVANFNGAAGMNGTNGSDGQDGAAGSMGSIDPNNPSAGGNGGDGTDGGDGADGDNGQDAPPVQVWLTTRAGAHPLLQAGVLAKGHKERFYLIDPAGGSLSISADGGDGGSGGRGGRGGRGGSGGDGIPSGSSGRDGLDGRSGTDGSSGRGGSIAVTYDASAAPYLAVIHLSNSGGPRPVFQQSPVGPLW